MTFPWLETQKWISWAITVKIVLTNPSPMVSFKRGKVVMISLASCSLRSPLGLDNKIKIEMYLACSSSSGSFHPPSVQFTWRSKSAHASQLFQASLLVITVWLGLLKMNCRTDHSQPCNVGFKSKVQHTCWQVKDLRMSLFLLGQLDFLLALLP